ncbi:MAG: membrane dipeptidase [Clostridia bacterium]|nr:membrane dipeptidase [Clostridia bacterium]
MDLFDGHCDTIYRAYQMGGGIRKSGGHLDLLRTRKYERYAQFFALFADREELGSGETLHEVMMAQYRIFLYEMEENSDLVSFCRTGKEAESAFQSGKSAAFLSVEGADLLNCDLALLEDAYHMGVRAVNLTWNHPNRLSGTNAEEKDRGLSGHGRAFVEKMQQLGMLIDVSHLSDPGFWDVVAMVKKPVIATHSNARSVFFDTRNLTDEQFTAIIKNNGVAGLNMYAGFLGKAPGLDTVMDHLEHFLSLGGEKNVALGGDWDGCSELPEGVGGIQDMDKLYERLLSRNYNETLVRGVFFTNMQRVVSKVCGM